MTASLLSLLFERLHAQAAPILWHTHCAHYPEELESLLAQRILVSTTPATRLPANHVPGEDHPLEVRRIGDAWIGTFTDDDDVHEVEVKEDYLLRYRIDLGAVITQLRRKIGIRDGISLRFDDGLLNLGDWASPDGPTRLYLAAPIPNPEALLARCRRLHALHLQRKVAVLTFSPVTLEVSLEEEFERRLGFSLRLTPGHEDAANPANLITRQEQKLAAVRAAHPSADFQTIYAKAKAEAPELFR